MNRNYGKLENGVVKYAPNAIDNDFNAGAAKYLAAGWKRIVDEYPTEPAPDGKHYERGGWTEDETTITRQWSVVDDVVVPRTFSKLKCYGALVSLGKWAEVKAWLEAQNLWDAFLLAQDVKEDNEYFTAGLAQFKAQFGMTDEQIEAILSQCVLEG